MLPTAHSRAMIHVHAERTHEQADHVDAASNGGLVQRRGTVLEMQQTIRNRTTKLPPQQYLGFDARRHLGTVNQVARDVDVAAARALV